MREERARGEDRGRFWGPRLRARIARQVEHIRHWVIHEGSWETVPHTGPATWFVDPTYVRQGRHYKFGSRYVDYGALGAWCRARPGQVIACEQVGATWLPFRPFRQVRSMGRARFDEAMWHRCDRGQLVLPLRAE